jgi:hypothetical protein
MALPCPFLLLPGKLPLQTLPRLWERRVGILDQLYELSLEPATGDWSVRQSACQVVAVQLIAGVGRVAHAVKAFAARVIGALWDQRTRSIGLSRRLDPHEGVDARDRVRCRPRADPRAILITPIPFVDALIDTGCHDERAQIGGSAWTGGPIRSAPTVARGVDDQADAGRIGVSARGQRGP